MRVCVCLFYCTIRGDSDVVFLLEEVNIFILDYKNKILFFLF